MAVLAAIGPDRKTNPIVATAYELASALADELVILHVIPDEEYEEHRDEVNDLPGTLGYSFTQEERSAARFARTVLDETLADYDEDMTRAIGRIGTPRAEILAAAEESDARYIVIGRRKRSPTGKAIFGSTTQAVLLNTDRPTVTVMTDEY